MEDKIDLRWRKSSYSGNGGGNCVEVAVGGRVMVRDSQDRAGTVLRFPPAAWREFADQVKRSLALDPALRVSHPLYRSACFPGYRRGAHPSAPPPAHLCSANGRGVWGGKARASGRPGTGRGFPRGSGVPLSAFPDLISSSWRRC